MIEPRPDLLPELIEAARERWIALSNGERTTEAQRIVEDLKAYAISQNQREGIPVGARRPPL
jgi:hypothetical protein